MANDGLRIIPRAARMTVQRAVQPFSSRLLIIVPSMVRLRVTAHQAANPRPRISIYVVAFVALLATLARSQPQEPAGSATLQGLVRDSNARPVSGATVYLEFKAAAQTLSVRADDAGSYRFPALREGVYILRTEMPGYSPKSFGPVTLAAHEVRNIDLQLDSPKPSATQTPSAGLPEFFDEPEFTVAGVTQGANSGGHGSDTVLRTTEALVRATVSLSKEPPANSQPASSAVEESLREAAEREPETFETNHELGKLLVDQGKAEQAIPFLEKASRLKPGDDNNSSELAIAYADAGNFERARTDLRALLARQDKPELHHLLGDVEEKAGDPLEAVREYQRASELDPSETNLFDWGAELLAHQGVDPALDVFTKGNHLFPRSVRMLIGFGVALYARGSYDQAALCLFEASDLNPEDPAPYWFLGKIQSVESTESKGFVERLGRFDQLQPENSLASYYYAVSLWKQSKGPEDIQNSERVEFLLLKAVHLDPNLAAGYLQLGILYAAQQNFPKAITAYQEAIVASPHLPEPHYRLGQAYQRTGDKVKAQEQLKIYEQLSKETAEEFDRERHEMTQFVFTLRDKAPAAQPPQKP